MSIPTPQPRLMQLTAEQREIVEWAGGPLMVLAGAGTGKTTVIVERARWLLETQPDLEPENVLVLTYNVKAARELGERLGRRLGVERAGRMTIANFHTFGYGLLRDNAAEAGLPDEAETLDGVGQRLLLLDIRPRLDLRYHIWGDDPSRAVGAFADLIARAKDELVTPEAYAAFADVQRAAFEDAHGPGSFEASIGSLVERGMIRDARDVRLALGGDALEREARRVARRVVRGDGVAGHDHDLTAEQRARVGALVPTLIRDAEALEVLRVTEEAQVYAAYQEEIVRRGALDFGEQVAAAIRLLEDRPNILRRLQRRYRHILVDEFQDANIAQIRLVELVGRAPDRPDDVVVVGDDDQSIYRFRGASFAAFRQFEELFSRPPAFAPDRPTPPVARRPLMLNRRSAGRILSAASRLIAVNPERLKAGDGPLRPSFPPGDPVEVILDPGEDDEAETVVGRIREIFAWLPDEIELPNGRTRPKRWGDIAVLYRAHAHRDQILDRLRHAGIPHVVIGGAGLFLQQDIRDLEAALRTIADPEDSVSFARVLSAAPWRLDAVEILRVTRAASFDRRPVFVAARQILAEGVIRVDGPPPVTPERADAGGAPANGATPANGPAPANGETVPPLPRSHREQVDAGLRAKLARVFDTLGDLSARANREGPLTLLDEYLVRTHALTDLVAVGTPDAQRSALAIARFMRFVADWQRARPAGSLADFVAYLDVYQQMAGDVDQEPPDVGDADGVQLMTVYQAKGLEYEAVIVPRLVEGRFPSNRGTALPIPVELLRQAPPSEFAIAEERRLLFVAMTRARRRLVLSALDGNGRPSRFVAEVAPEGGVATDPAIHGGPGPTIARWGDGPDDVVVTIVAPAEVAVPDEADVDEGGEEAPRSAMLGATAVPRSSAAATGGAEAAATGGAVAAPDLDAAISEDLAVATAAAQAWLLRRMPVPAAFERRFALRRRAVELIGALESVAPDDTAARDAIVRELVAVADEAAGVADEQRRNGVDPLTLRVLSRHDPAGRILLELAPLPSAFSHSQLNTYRECPLRYAFERVYRVPIVRERGYFTFGSAVHKAFEDFVTAKRAAAASGEPPPGIDDLRGAFDRAWDPTLLGDEGRAKMYEARIPSTLARFYDRELRNPATAIRVEADFIMRLDGAAFGEPVSLVGQIDRIDRLPDGSVEIIDYKTGHARSQADVDRDDQLSLYALALREGAVSDPETGDPLQKPSRLTLYFVDEDRALTTTRTDEQLDEFRGRLLATAARIRAGDFAATPSFRTCERCDYARLCPNRHREPGS